MTPFSAVEYLVHPVIVGRFSSSPSPPHRSLLRDSVSLFDHVSGAAPAPPATADVSTRSQWLSRDATARLAIRNHLPATECAHFGEHRTAQALYDAVVARYSSPATAALGRLLLPYLFHELSAFATVADLVTHLRTSDARYRATVPAEFLPTNQPPMFITLYFIVTCLPDSLRSVRDHFLTLDPTSLTVDLLKQHLLAAETSAVAVGAARGTPRSPFFEGCSPSPLSSSFASAAAADVSVPEDVGAALTVGVVVGAAVEEAEAVEVVAAVGPVAEVEALVAVVEAAEGVAAVEAVGPVVVGLDLSVEAVVVVGASSSSVGVRLRRLSSSRRCFALLDYAWRTEFGDDVERPRWAELLRSGVAIFDLDFDVIISAMYALSFSAEGDCYWCVPPDPGIAAAALGASASGTPPGTAPAEALHTFTLDYGVSHSSSCTTAWVTPPCHAFVACTPASLSLVSPGLCLPCRPRLPRPVFLASRDGSAPLLTPPRFPRRLLPCKPSTWTCEDQPAKGEFSAVLIPWIRTVRLQLRERFGKDLPVLRLHSDRGGEFSSDLLRDFCRGEGITQSFTLPDSPQRNGIAERRIGLVMEVARTSMIHAAAPHFLWPFAVQYAAHQLNLWPRVSLPETSPTLRWTGKVGDASVFRVWGSRAFVRDTSADKLSALATPCVCLGFVPDAPGWQFYHPTSRCVLPSQDVTFDESVPFYRLFPYRSAPSPPPPLFLAPAVVSGAAPGAASWGAEPGGAGSKGARSGGAELEGVEPGGAESEGAGPEGAESEGAESGGAEPRGAALSGGPAGASPRLSSQQLREWLVQRAHCRSGAPGAGEPGGAGAGGAAVTTRAGDPTEPGAAGAGGAGAGVAGVGGPGAGGAGGAGAGAVDPGAEGAGGTVRPRPYFAPLLEQVLGVPSSTGLPPPFVYPPPDQSQPPLQPASPLPVPSPYTEQSRGLTERREPASRPVSPVRPARRAPRSCPPPVPGTHTMALRPSSVPLRVPLPTPPDSSLPADPDPESDRARATSPTVARLLASAVTDPSFESAAASALVAELLDFAAAYRLDYASALVAESVPAIPASVGGECALGTDVLEDRQEDFECLAAAVPRFASFLLAPEGDPDAPDIPTPRSYAEAIEGPYSSQWQAAMDAEMASWKSTSTYVDEVPPPGVNIVDGMRIFRGVDYFQTFSPTPKMTTLRVLLHVAAQRDYELHSLEFSTAFLQGSLHEEVWLRRPPGSTGTTFLALGFVPSTADPLLFLRTDTSLPPFYVLVYVDDLVFATADTDALTLVKSELQKRHTCTDLGELRSYLGLQITRDRARRTITLSQSHMVHQVLQRFGFQYSSPQLTPLSTSHSLSAPPSDESVELSGPYPELVGCLMYLMTCTRPDLVYPLSLLAYYVAPVRRAWGLCLEDGVLLSSLVTQTPPSSSCEAEIYAGAMAAQELRWLTYLLTDLGEQPRSPPVLYVDNKAMIAWCQEHRLEHRTKHIALRYFLARELQLRGQLRLAYVATRANTADVFTKALPPGDHQRFVTVLGLLALLCFFS
ncbi:unnamed protein product [Closterium sp. NIES-53]